MVIVGISLLATGGLVFVVDGDILSQGGFLTMSQDVGDVNITVSHVEGKTYSVLLEYKVSSSEYEGVYTFNCSIGGKFIKSVDKYVGSAGYGYSSISVTYDGYKTGELTVEVTAVSSMGSLEPPATATINVGSTEPTYYDLTVNSETGGTTSPSGTKSYEEGTSVNVTATANSGYQFDGWSGASSSTSSSIDVKMDSDKTLTAQFSEVQQPTEYYLTTETEGMGSVSAEGSNPYDEGAYIQVEADPDSGWKFDRWEGDISGTSNPTFVTMDSDKTVRAVFVEEQVETYSLSTTVYSGQGSVSVFPEKSEYGSGDEVTLTAEPDEGYVFKEWRGDATGSSNPITITMNSDRSVSAVFESEQPDKVTLTMRSSPVEGGTVSMLQANEIQVTKGKEVTIQAYSNEGYSFDQWSGDVEGESKSVNVIMDSDKEVIANFAEEKGIVGMMIANVHYLLMILGSVILVGGIVKISR